MPPRLGAAPSRAVLPGLLRPGERAAGDPLEVAGLDVVADVVTEEAGLGYLHHDARPGREEASLDRLEGHELRRLRADTSSAALLEVARSPAAQPRVRALARLAGE